MKNKKKQEESVQSIAPIRPPKKTEQSLRVQYTDKELLEIGKKLAEANREHSQAEDEKKSITGTLKAKCDSIAARIQQHSGELTNGYTYRTVPCEVHYDTPAKGMKQTIRLDSGETIETQAMTLYELQADLPLSDGSGAEEIDEIVKRSTAANGVVLTEEDDDGFIDDKNNP